MMKTIFIVAIAIIQLQCRDLNAQVVKLSATLAKMWERGESERVYQTALNRLKRDPNDYLGLSVKGDYEIRHGKLKDYKATLRRMVPAGDAVSIPEFKYMWNDFTRGLAQGFPDAIEQKYPGVDVLPSTGPISSAGDSAFGSESFIAIFERAGAIAPGWELDIPPVIISFNPASGGAGASIVVTGTYLTAASAVTLADHPVANFTINSPTQITVIIPNAGATGPLKVTTAAGVAVSAQSFTFTAGASP